MRMMLRRSGIAQPLARMWLYRGRVSDSLSRPRRRAFLPLDEDERNPAKEKPSKRGRGTPQKPLLFF